jgi:hypothetical protein
MKRRRTISVGGKCKTWKTPLGNQRTIGGWLPAAHAEGLAGGGAAGPVLLFGQDQFAVAGKAETVFLAVMLKDHLAVSFEKLRGLNPHRLAYASFRRFRP